MQLFVSVSKSMNWKWHHAYTGLLIPSLLLFSINSLFLTIFMDLSHTIILLIHSINDKPAMFLKSVVAETSFDTSVSHWETKVRRTELLECTSPGHFLQLIEDVLYMVFSLKKVNLCWWKQYLRGTELEIPFTWFHSTHLCNDVSSFKKIILAIEKLIEKKLNDQKHLKICE